MQPVFSIVHTSNRPDGWRQVHAEWMRKAAHPEQVEYILSVDKDGPFEHHRPVPGDVRLVWNTGRKCAVDGYNAGCAEARGKILILASDDMFPPNGWDEDLTSIVKSYGNGSLDRDFVIEVSSGTPADARRLMVLSILSRARFEKLGYAFFPEYDSMYADDDFTEQARQDGVVIDARQLVFQHRHPIYDKSVEWDDTYLQQNANTRYSKGKEIFLRRRATRFGTVSKKQSVAICMPGVEFSARWVMAMFSLLDDIRKLGFDALPVNCYSSDPGVTRDTLSQNLLTFVPRPDYVLWIDDDNVLSTTEFQKLMLDLNTFPELDAVFAWCWLQADGYLLQPMVSCGRLQPSGSVVPFTPQEMWDNAQAGNLMALGASGFPAVLMHFRLLEKAGSFPFAPIVGEQHPHGKIGEDYSFCIHSLERGAKLAVDPQVKIPHLKLGEYEPDLRQVIRVKQEANAAD